MGTIHGGIGFEFMRISVDLTEQGLSKFFFKVLLYIYMCNNVYILTLILSSSLSRRHSYYIQVYQLVKATRCSDTYL